MKNFLAFVIVASMLAIPACSQVLFEENFDTAAEKQLEDVINPDGEIVREGELYNIVPDNWTIHTELRPEDDGFKAEFPYPGWTSLFVFEWDTQGGNRETNPDGFDEGFMVADSDLFGDLGARSWLYSPLIELPDDKNAIVITFDNHYRHNDNQLVTLEVSWDEGESFEGVFQWDDTNRTDNQDYITEEVHSVEIPEGATNVQLLFRFAGDEDQDGFHDFDWYWAFDNLVVTAKDIDAPNAPTLQAGLVDPEQLGSDIILTGSEFISDIDATHEKSLWQVALDQEFNNLLFSTGDTTENLTEIVVDSAIAPLNSTIYARVRYTDNNGSASEFSNVEEIIISVPAGLKQIFFEDFEDVDEGSLPEGWKEVNFNDPLTGDETTDLVATWTVITEETLASYGSDRVNIPVFEGKSVYVDSDVFEPYQEAYLFTPAIDLSGVSDVWLSFGSNYVQNQDNIGTLEYSVDGGDIDEGGSISGTWNPITYMLEDVDVVFDDEGNPIATDTLANEADGTGFPYAAYVWAEPLEDLNDYISPRINDDKRESKRFERYRLSEADDQSNVVIRWLNMGTDSWFWGLDNVTIWGDDGTDVSNWSLY